MLDLIEVVKISQSAPSACNRQSSKVYIYTNKEKIKKILEIQGGNRGFGHLSDKLIIITSNLGVWGSLAERYQSYVDGGIFAMNLLYALHFKKIAGCILNCSITPEKDKMLRGVCEIDRSENFIAMVSCGYPPEQIKIASSKRFDTNSILKIIE
jgi:nitroreductase